MYAKQQLRVYQSLPIAWYYVLHKGEEDDGRKMGEDDIGKTGRDFILSGQLVAGGVVIGPPDH